jgi:hypothetical protein
VVFLLVLESVGGRMLNLPRKNITANWVLNHLGFIVNLVYTGYHSINPAMIANMAPIDST